MMGTGIFKKRKFKGQDTFEIFELLYAESDSYERKEIEEQIKKSEEEQIKYLITFFIQTEIGLFLKNGEEKNMESKFIENMKIQNMFISMIDELKWISSKKYERLVDDIELIMVHAFLILEKEELRDALNDIDGMEIKLSNDLEDTLKTENEQERKIIKALHQLYKLKTLSLIENFEETIEVSGREVLDFYIEQNERFVSGEIDGLLNEVTQKNNRPQKIRSLFQKELDQKAKKRKEMIK